MSRSSLLLLAALWSTILPSVVAANNELIVLDEIGATDAIPTVQTLKRLEQSPPPIPSRIETTEMAVVFPLKTQWMQPQLVEPATIDRALSAKPLALVGADNLSASWLKKNAGYLASIDATVWIISASTQLALDTIKSFVPGNTTFVGTADSLHSILPHNGYPVLIIDKQVIQK